jgi:class 3 adenylate cyclase
VATPGGIVISAATLDQLAGRATVQSIGPVDLKGKSQPVDTYRLLAFGQASTDLDEH